LTGFPGASKLADRIHNLDQSGAITMEASEFKQLLKRRPFGPLRIHMTDGTTYDIFHPDNIFVLHSRIDIGVGADPNGVLDRVDYCSLDHVVRVEELSKKAKPKSGKS
jgi:hypothetical protein